MLADQGFVRPRLPLREPVYDDDAVEIVVTAESGTTMLNLARAERQLTEDLGQRVDIVPDGSERGREIGTESADP